MLRRHAPRREMLLDEAVGVYVERLASLWAAAYPKAINADTRSQVVCRRLLDQHARVQGLYGSAASEPLVREGDAGCSAGGLAQAPRGDRLHRWVLQLKLPRAI
jgi:hypothetical protein